jgi:hypothetical protein
MNFSLRALGSDRTRQAGIVGIAALAGSKKRIAVKTGESQVTDEPDGKSGLATNGRPKATKSA